MQLDYTTLRRIVPSRQRIEVIREPAGRRYRIRRDGKYSTKVPEATASQIVELIRRWLVANT